MKIEEFNKAVKEQLLTCENMLLNKGHEYAPDAAETNDVDRLAHFKKAAAIMGTTQKAALLGMLTKHLVSIPICAPIRTSISATAGLRKSRTVSTIC